MDEAKTIIVVEPAPTHTLVEPVHTDHSGATSDEQLVELWLSTKTSPHTQRAYASDATAFLSFLGDRDKTLGTAMVADVQAWVEQLEGKAATRARRVAAVKSLLSFGHKTGYLMFNVGRVLSSPKVPNSLAERILSEEEVLKMIMVSKGRDETLLRFLYGSGARISEACDLRWEHIHPQESGEAVVTLHGKGGKTRHVLVSKSVSEALLALKPDDALPEAPVFATRTGNPLHPANVVKSVRRLASKAGITRPVSPHWFRHAHASHALDRGAPVHLVQNSLGHASVATTGKYLHAKPGDGSGRYLVL